MINRNPVNPYITFYDLRSCRSQGLRANRFLRLYRSMQVRAPIARPRNPRLQKPKQRIRARKSPCSPRPKAHRHPCRPKPRLQQHPCRQRAADTRAGPGPSKEPADTHPGPSQESSNTFAGNRAANQPAEASPAHAISSRHTEQSNKQPKHPWNQHRGFAVAGTDQ